MYESNYCIEDQVLNLEIVGDISVHDILNEAERALSLWKSSNPVKLLADVSKINIIGGIDDVYEVNELNKDVVKNFTSVDVGFVCDDVKVTSLAYLFETISMSDTYKFKVFSYKLAALSWVNDLEQ